jgi:hypothetical protein
MYAPPPDPSALIDDDIGMPSPLLAAAAGPDDSFLHLFSIFRCVLRIFFSIFSQSFDEF